MNYFEELTGKRIFFTKYDSFYWDNIHKEPLSTSIIPDEEFDDIIPNNFVGVKTEDVIINENFTIKDFLNKYQNNCLVFCLNNDSIYHYRKKEDEKETYIKVYIDYKN